MTGKITDIQGIFPTTPRPADAGKTGPALVTATINRLLMEGMIGRINGRLVASPEARH